MSFEDNYACLGIILKIIYIVFLISCVILHAATNTAKSDRVAAFSMTNPVNLLITLILV